MKITVTEIEANANELQASNTLTEGISSILRRAFNRYPYYLDDTEENEEEN